MVRDDGGLRNLHVIGLMGGISCGSALVLRSSGPGLQQIPSGSLEGGVATL